MEKTSVINAKLHFTQPNLHMHVISDSVALRIHSDTKPQNMKIANLQKGMVLLYRETEVVGEGTGFGVPIVKYSDETFFSGSSFLQVYEKEDFVIVRKEFFMDLVERGEFRNLKIENLKTRKLIDTVSLLYQKHKRFAKFILYTKELLFKFGVKSNFIRTQSRGKVIVTYTLNRNKILVNLNFTDLVQDKLQKIFVLNEQGAHFFRKYLDSDRINLTDDEIGAWNIVAAESAKITDKQNTIGFSLENVDGAVLRRGRELVKGSLNWIGLDYELNSAIEQFEYEVEIFG